MKASQRLETNAARRNSSERSGYTLVELIVSMTAATVLMVGLASTLLIASVAFDGNGPAVKRSAAAEVHADMMADLRHALRFTERTANAMTFTVPDRDGDGQVETIRYAWSGTAADPLTIAYNGGPAATVAEDVNQFNLTYLNRFMAAPTLPGPAPLAPAEWGYRWLVFGYKTIFTQPISNINEIQIATQATLSQGGTLTSITVYIHGSDDQNARVAIYDDISGEPGNLIVQSNKENVPTGPAWYEFSTLPPTPLAAGTYWLALGLRQDQQEFFREDTGGQTRYNSHNPIGGSGFLSVWGASSGSFPYKVSIYGTVQ